MSSHCDVNGNDGNCTVGVYNYISQMSKLFSLLNHQSKNYVMVIFD